MADGLVKIDFKYIGSKDSNEVCNIELKWSEVVKEILLHVSLASTKDEEVFTLDYISKRISKFISKKIDEERPMQKLLRGNIEVALLDESTYKITRYLVKNEFVRGFYNENREKVFAITDNGIDFLDNLIL